MKKIPLLIFNSLLTFHCTSKSTENALRSLTIDVVEQLQKSAAIIGSDESSGDDKLDAMEIILNYVDDIDTATDFCKIGGLYVLKPSLASDYPTVRCKAASIVAELAQNNPYCQKELLEMDFLPAIMNLLSEKETTPDGLRALSGLVRSYEPCLNAFIDIGGIECLLGCLQQLDQEKTLARTMFLLSSLCADFPSLREKLIGLKVVDLIVAAIQPQEEYNFCLETALSVLCTLTEDSEAVERCRTNESDFSKTLQEIITLANNKTECQETIAYSELLLERMADTRGEVEVTDR